MDLIKLNGDEIYNQQKEIIELKLQFKKLNILRNWVFAGSSAAAFCNFVPNANIIVQIQHF